MAKVENVFVRDAKNLFSKNNYQNIELSPVILNKILSYNGQVSLSSEIDRYVYLDENIYKGLCFILVNKRSIHNIKWYKKNKDNKKDELIMKFSKMFEVSYDDASFYFSIIKKGMDDKTFFKFLLYIGADEKLIKKMGFKDFLEIKKVENKGGDLLKWFT